MPLCPPAQPYLCLSASAVQLGLPLLPRLTPKLPRQRYRITPFSHNPTLQIVWLSHLQNCFWNQISSRLRLTSRPPPPLSPFWLPPLAAPLCLRSSPLSATQA